MRRQRDAHWRSCCRIQADKTRGDKGQLLIAESSGPTNAGSRSLETVDAAGAGRPPLGLHNRAE